MKFFIILLVLFSTNLMVTYGSPLEWDNVPIISQGKMAFLYIMGKENEVEETWSHFKNKTQLWRSIKNFDDNIPGYGYVKSGMILLTGNEDNRALEIFALTHKTTCTLGGFVIGNIVGGPVGGSVGGVIGSILADGTSSFLYNKPVNMIDHALRLSKNTASENIDAALDLIFAAVGPQIGQSIIQKSKHKISLSLERNNPTQTSWTSSELEKVFTNPSPKNAQSSSAKKRESYSQLLIRLDSEEQKLQRQKNG